MGTRAELKRKAEDFSNALARTIHAARLHPQIRCSERLKRLTELEYVAAKDADEAFTAETTAKRKRLAQDDALEVGPLANVTMTEQKYQLDYFDLNDDSPEKSHVDPQLVTQIVLDRLSDELRVDDPDRVKYRNEVRGVLFSKQLKQPVPAPGSVLTRTELLWHDLLRYQIDNPWDRCTRAASLAGRLLLFDWEQNRLYTRVREKGGVDAWEFPERFFGGIYNEDMRKHTGHKLKPLYDTHCALVKAGVGYALATRNRMLEMNQVVVGHTRNAADPNVLSLESKADHLVMRFFPWVGASNLGLAANICKWDQFQRDLLLFAEVYDTYWTNRPVAVGKDGQPHQLPDSECTWAHFTKGLCTY